MSKLDDLIANQTILQFPGYQGVASRCAVTRFGNTVIATEIEDNPGTHLDDALEIVATRIVEEFGIEPDKLQLIEDIPGRDPRFALITLTPGDSYMHIQRVKFVGASWQTLSSAEVEALINPGTPKNEHQ